MLSKKGIILLSGGVDSAVVLAMAVAQEYEMHSIFFDYGQPAAKEEERFANLVSSRYGSQAFHKVELGQGMFGFPDEDTFEFPLRNLVLISAAAAIAVNRNRPNLFVGINSAAGPESGGIEYPDCSLEFVEAAEISIKLCYEDLNLHVPLLRVDKVGVFGMAAALGISLDSTFSCLNPKDTGSSVRSACEECISCVERKNALGYFESL